MKCVTCDQPLPEEMERHPRAFGYYGNSVPADDDLIENSDEIDKVVG